MRFLYLDSSAIVKLVVSEEGSAALAAFVSSSALVSSALARVEVVRAIWDQGETVRRKGRRVLRGFDLFAIDDEILERAAGVEPRTLHSLDAIHTATALSLGDDLRAFVTYDERQGQAVSALGLSVESPA